MWMLLGAVPQEATRILTDASLAEGPVAAVLRAYVAHVARQASRSPGDCGDPSRVWAGGGQRGNGDSKSIETLVNGSE